METLQQKQLAFLNETISHFNSTNRSQGSATRNKACFYYHPKFDGCAIGRKIEDVNLRKRLDTWESSGVADPIVFSVLPENLKELGRDFLTHIQKLHDNELNWVETGLSNKGKSEAEQIKRIFGLA